MGENLTFSFRKQLFESIVYKSISWFDSKERAPGILTNILSEDITKLNGLTTETVGILLESALGFIIGILISFNFSWRISLVCIGCSPLLLLGAVFSK
jgi:ABC-type multidrug transport system fused ATPase/permease subunit